jgi:hypothetical protein
MESECPKSKNFSVDYVPALVVFKSWGQDLFVLKCYISEIQNLYASVICAGDWHRFPSSDSFLLYQVTCSSHWDFTCTPKLWL